MISKWGTPKTPAPSGPLTLYVGPSRDAGRLRARRDRHRAAAPALSNGDGLSKQTHSAVLARGLGAGRAFAASGGPPPREGRPSSAVCKCVVSLSPVGGDLPSSWVTQWSPLLEAPSKLSRSCPPTC